MSHAHLREPRAGLPRPVGVLLVVLVLVAMIGGAGIAATKLLDSFGTDDYSGAGTGEVSLKIVSGQTATDIARNLEQLDVVKSAQAFTEAAEKDTRSRGIQPGSYKLRAQMSGKDALGLLLDPKSRTRGTVVIPEGLTQNQVLQRIADATDIELPALKAAAGNAKALGLPAWAEGHVEGLLFPATYEVEPEGTATEVLRSIIARFEEEVAALDLVERAAQLGVEPYEVVTIASLLEREVRKQDELVKVSRVIYNRLEEGMRLDIDAAVLYGLGRTSGGLTRSDLDKETPYNLRNNVRGLPPTAIASPGAAALKAALEPAKGDWLYYLVAKADGTQFFFETLTEFNVQKRKSQEAGLL